jgi:hypothetical protein
VNEDKEVGVEQLRRLATTKSGQRCGGGTPRPFAARAAAGRAAAGCQAAPRLPHLPRLHH